MFPYVFWDASKDMFGRVVADPAARGGASLFYSHAHLSGGATLAALVAGAAAEALEAEPPAEAVARVMGVIRRIHEPRGIQVPAPIQARAWLHGAAQQRHPQTPPLPPRSEPSSASQPRPPRN